MLYIFSGVSCLNYYWTRQNQKIPENVKNNVGEITSMMLSKRWGWISRFQLLRMSLTLPVFFLLVLQRIYEYSMMAMVMKRMQLTIQSMIALGFPPDLGDVLDTEFSMLTLQRNKVSRRARRPGMASWGTT